MPARFLFLTSADSQDLFSRTFESCLHQGKKAPRIRLLTLHNLSPVIRRFPAFLAGKLEIAATVWSGCLSGIES
jgi:hypothetical protein